MIDGQLLLIGNLLRECRFDLRDGLRRGRVRERARLRIINLADLNLRIICHLNGLRQKVWRKPICDRYVRESRINFRNQLPNSAINK